jgi:hypothetical protein
MRDCEILISLSAPQITGDTAIVHLHRKENGFTPQQPTSDAWLRYTLKRVGAGWTVAKVDQLQIS